MFNNKLYLISIIVIWMFLSFEFGQKVIESLSFKEIENKKVDN